jgi:hypothetical protein
VLLTAAAKVSDVLKVTKPEPAAPGVALRTQAQDQQVEDARDGRIEGPPIWADEASRRIQPQPAEGQFHGREAPATVAVRHSAVRPIAAGRIDEKRFGQGAYDRPPRGSVASCRKEELSA